MPVEGHVPTRGNDQRNTEELRAGSDGEKTLKRQKLGEDHTWQREQPDKWHWPGE